MGAVLGSLMGGVTMGVTSSAINCVCFACPWGSSSVAKYLHIFIFLASLTGAFLWHLLASGPFAFPAFPKSVEGDAIEKARYFGPWVIVSGLCVYHLLMAMLLIGVRSSADRRAIVQNGGWPIKVFGLLACILTCYFTPPVCYVYLFYVAVGSAVIFLALQSVYLVDLAYRGADLLVEKYEESEGEIWKYALFSLTGLLYTIAILMTLAIMYHHGEHLLVAVLNILIMVAVSVCSILEEVQEANPQAGIFQAAFISFYNTFLLVSSTIHEKSMKNKISGWEGTINAFSWILFTAGLWYYAATIGTNPDDVHAGSSAEKGEESLDEAQSCEYSMSLFHVYLITAALYSILSLVSWRPVIHLDPPKNGKVLAIGDISLKLCKWSPIMSSWILTGLYLWSLFAPLVFPDRDFS